MSADSAGGRAARGGSPRDETGTVTSEYAVATLGACGVACVLITLAPGFADFFGRIFDGAFSPIITGLVS